MTSSPVSPNYSGKPPHLVWQLILFSLLCLTFVAVALEKPAGSIAGRLALEQEGFNLYSYDLRKHKVYALAIGPRGRWSQERGVWVKEDGNFRIDSLPVGEYELKVHVPGFATSYNGGIFVEKNQVTRLKRDITLELSNPSVNVAATTRVFTSTEKPHFWLNANGSSRATVTVYKREMLPLLRALTQGKTPTSAQALYGFELSPDLSIYKPYDKKAREKADAFFKQMQPVQTWHRELATDQSDYAHEEFKFDRPLPAGDYFAVAEVTNLQNKKDWNLLWFTVTDIGLIVKQDAWQTVVRAIDLNTLKPLPQLEVQLLNRERLEKPTMSARTDAQGFARMSFKTPLTSSQNLLAYAARDDHHAYGAYGFYNSTDESMTTYFYTDRPVYRLGQTVYYKGIARARAMNGFKNPGGNVKVSINVEDPDNNSIHTDEFKTSAHGTFHGLIEIPKDGKTGGYQVTITYPDGSQSYERFEVAEYRKPEYKVDVIPLAPRVVAGDKVKARIKAAYYFGAPVTNARVKYTVYSSIDWAGRYELMDRPAYYQYFDGWDHEDEGYYDGGYNGDYITEGYATTDENGEALVEIETRRSSFDANRPWEYDRYDRRYKVEAEVTDISRLSVLGSGAVQVTNGSFGLFVNPDSYIARVGDTINADINAVSYENHKPLANKEVKVQLYRRIYDRNRGEYKGIEIVEKRTVTTDGAGRARVSFVTRGESVTDDYDILAVSEDSNHNVTVDQSSIWIVSSKAPFRLGAEQAKKEPLSVKLDKEVYKSGETAKVMITAPVTGDEGAQAIVAVEGARLYDYQLVDMTATARMVEIPLKVDYAPNVFVTVTFIGKKHQYYNQTAMIRVSPEERFLELDVQTDKAKYKPGEMATYTVTAKHADGKPAADTELSLAVVDESIFAIRPDFTPDIRKFFYARRQNMVNTICSFPVEYSGGPNKIEPRVRKDFRDTAAWLPTLVTDKDGVARTTIKMPDNLTTWRATVRAVSRDLDVGSTVQKVVSTQDLILRLALPRFYTQGDEGYITAVVHNYTDKPQAVNLTLAPTSEFRVKDNLVQKLTVAPDKAMRFNWAVNCQTAGEATVSCRAIGDTAGDAMQVKVPVLPLGIEETIVKSGVLNGDEQTVDVQSAIPGDAVPGSVKHHLYLSSSSLGPLLGNFSALIDYPYGCTEQTMSRLMPAVVAVRMNQTLGMPLSDADKKKFQEVYKMSMAKLDGYQHGDGGWGWWANDESQIYLTALVLDGYGLLKEAGYAVDPTRLNNGKAWLIGNLSALHRQLRDPQAKPDPYTRTERTIDFARAYYVLAKNGVKVPAEVKSWLLTNKNTFTPEVLSSFAVALHKQGDKQAARELYDRLLDLGNVTTSDGGNMLDWSPSKAMVKKIFGKSDWTSYSYRYTDVETSAIAMEAVLMLEPENQERIESIKRWILMSRSANGWDNTKTTAQVFRSFMAAELAGKQAGGRTDFHVDVLAGKQPSRQFDFGAGSIFQPEKDAVVQLKNGYSQISLRKSGPGKLYYTNIITYYRAIKPGQGLGQKSMPDGLKLRREFFKLVASPPDSAGNVTFKAQPLPNRTVRAGETILMKVYVESPTDIPYTFLKAPLPSGAEVVENDQRADASEEGEESGNSSNQAYEWGDWWWTHQDVMDDHLAFFVTEFRNGKSEFHQMVRMEIPGKFQMNPVYLEGMYTKQVRSHSAADVITVTE